MGTQQRRDGFTVLELLIFAAIFSVVTITFITILVAVTRVHVQQSSVAEVNGQSQFLLQNLQSAVEQSSLIEMAADTASSTLTLRMATTSIDPTVVSLSDGIVYLTQGTSSPQALTTNKVTVNSLTFTKRAHTTGGHDTVAIAFTMDYNTTNRERQFSHIIDTSIARVSAATFDSNVIPSSNNLYKLGASSQVWTNINDSIYFSSPSVGIGVSNPVNSTLTLEVNGGLRLNTATSKPSCASGYRGAFWVTESGSGTKDAVEVCARDASSTYAWRTIY